MKMRFILSISVLTLCACLLWYFLLTEKDKGSSENIHFASGEEFNSGMDKDVKQDGTEERMEDVDFEDTGESETDVSENVEESVEQKMEDILTRMSVEEKIAQMFVITPEALTGYSSVTAAGEVTKNALAKYPVGGLIYFDGNIQSEGQVTEMIKMQQQYSLELTGLPLFISIDEEGGSVTRIAKKNFSGIPQFPDMREIGNAENGMEQAGELGDSIGSYLHRLGFNLDYAPVADVLTNPQNTVVKARSFGTDPEKVSDLVIEVFHHLEQQGVYGCLKHFPGHGATAQDSHNGFASVDRTLEEMRSSEFVPFQKGIDAGVSFVMAGHISVPDVVGDNTPASMSKTMITDILRNEMNFDGIVITDAMNMGAISNEYDSASAAVRAIEAGVDMVLMPVSFLDAYNGVLGAVQEGRISEERIDVSLKRIIKKKLHQIEIWN